MKQYNIPIKIIEYLIGYYVIAEKEKQGFVLANNINREICYRIIGNHILECL